MARLDRCSVCDYSEGEGAPHIGINPGAYGRVRLYSERNEYLCEACLDMISDTLLEMHIRDLEELDEEHAKECTCEICRAWGA